MSSDARSPHLRRSTLLVVGVALLAVSGGDAAALATGLVATPLQFALGDDVDRAAPTGGQGAVSAGHRGPLDGVSLPGAPADPNATACTIVAFGDSYTWGWGAAVPEQSYASRMERALGHPVVNAGVAGETAAEGFQRIESDVLAYEPCLVVVGFGTNEAFRGYPVEAALDGIERIVQRLHQEDVPVVIVGTHMGNQDVHVDAGLMQIAGQYDAFLVVGVLDGILSDPALRGDAFHPNGDGYARMWERVEPVARSALQRPA